MSVQFKRVKRSEYPLLVIGLGGTGTDALLAIMDQFNRHYELSVSFDGYVMDRPERTAYLAFDTNRAEIVSKKRGSMKLTEESMLALTMPYHVDAGTQSSYISSWLDKRLNGFKIQNGTGGNRQAGRYAFFYHADAIYDKLKQVIHKLLSNPAYCNRKETLDAVITTGICGGTGSGIFLDMAYLLRCVMEKEFPNVDCCITAYIMTPSVNTSQITPAQKEAMEANGFAALKELDYWMNEDALHFDYVQMYSPSIEIKWRAKPFNNVILMDSKNEHGDLISDSYWDSLEQVGMSLFLFYAATNTQFTLRDLELQRRLSKFHNMLIRYPANHEYLAVGCVCEWTNEKKIVDRREYDDCDGEIGLDLLLRAACTRLHRMHTGGLCLPSHMLVGIPANDFAMREKVCKHLQHDFCELIETQTETFFLMRVVNGVPLCEYADLAKLEQSYEKILRNQNASLHLV